MSTPYTHTGYRPRVGHRHIGKHANHYEGQTGETHACNFRGGYTGLCGVRVDENAENIYGDPIEVIFPAGVKEVTCRKCRKLIGLEVKPKPKKSRLRFGS